MFCGSKWQDFLNVTYKNDDRSNINDFHIFQSQCFRTTVPVALKDILVKSYIMILPCRLLANFKLSCLLIKSCQWELGDADNKQD